MRHFWLPALLSRELPEAGGDPVHLELLGESFVAFRAADGTVGILDELCCHRGASLTVGRVEQCGIRCVYHGWLFAADGKVLETPNVQDQKFKERFTARAWPVREAGGLIWAYLGDPDSMPAFPDFPWIDAQGDSCLTAVQVIGANYLQIMEGVFDSSHLSILHSSALNAAAGDAYRPSSTMDNMCSDAAPRIEAEETDFGLHYAAIRSIDGVLETRVAAFIAPFWVQNPNGDLIQGFVPMGDDKTAFYHVWWDGKTRFGEEPAAARRLAVVGLDQPTLEAHGMTRTTFYGPDRMSRANGWQQDRQRMREGHFSGMAGIAQEDLLVSITPGTIRDRSRERLSTADRQIAQLYRVLLRTARQVEEGGKPVGHGQSVAHIVGRSGTIESGEDWRSLVPEHRSADRASAA